MLRLPGYWPNPSVPAARLSGPDPDQYYPFNDPLLYVGTTSSGSGVHQLDAIAGLPFATGSVQKLAANPVSLSVAAVTESNGNIVAYNGYNNTPTGDSVRVPLGAIVSSATDTTPANTTSDYVTGTASGQSVIHQINATDTAVTGAIPVPGPGYVADEGGGTLVYAASPSSGGTVLTLPVATSVIR